MIAIYGFVFGISVGYLVTKWLYQGGGWPEGYWTKHISRRFIRANIPVGFVIFGIVALLAPSSESRIFWGAAALGMGVSAVNRAFYSWQPKD